MVLSTHAASVDSRLYIVLHIAELDLDLREPLSGLLYDASELILRESPVSIHICLLEELLGPANHEGLLNGGAVSQSKDTLCPLHPQVLVSENGTSARYKQ